MAFAVSNRKYSDFSTSINKNPKYHPEILKPFGLKSEEKNGKITQFFPVKPSP